MKRFIIISLVLAITSMMVVVTPIVASIDITGIYYNFDAAENESALTVKWTGKPAFEIKANEFYSRKVGGQMETMADVEIRIQDKFLDLLVDDTKLSTIDADDEVRQDPPVLVPGEEIVIINNQEYLRTWKAYFKIHIYSLDNLDTPESELRFVTRFQNVRAGQIPDDWWPE